MFTAHKTKHQPLFSSAYVVDGKLILSLPDALTPVVWQMDMADAKASALEVRENKERQNFMLFLKTQKGDDTEIAPFETREAAVNALMAVTRALENAHGQIRPAIQNNTPPLKAGRPIKHNTSSAENRGLGKWIALSVIIIGLIFIIGALQNVRSPAGLNPAGLQNTNTAGGFAGNKNVNESGVPLSADEFLMNR